MNEKKNKIIDKISDERLKKYFSITKEAINEIKKKGIDEEKKEQALDFLDMASRYYSDAEFFYSKKEFVNSFACLNYAHGWLDAGARIKLFKVNNSRLFTVDEE